MLSIASRVGLPAEWLRNEREELARQGHELSAAYRDWTERAREVLTAVVQNAYHDIRDDELFSDEGNDYAGEVRALDADAQSRFDEVLRRHLTPHIMERRQYRDLVNQIQRHNRHGGGQQLSLEMSVRGDVMVVEHHEDITAYNNLFFEYAATTHTNVDSLHAICAPVAFRCYRDMRVRFARMMANGEVELPLRNERLLRDPDGVDATGVIVTTLGSRG